MTVTGGGLLALEGWRLVRQMLDDLTEPSRPTAETELCSELSLDVDAAAPLVTTRAIPAGGQ